MPFSNRIRISVRVKHPQFPENREVFRRADGVTKTLSVQVRKTYILETGLMPESLHERLKISLAHDTVSIYNDRLLSGISQDGGYTIDWPDFQDFPIAKATATIQVTPFNATNSNCKTCDEFAQVVAEDDEFPNNAYGEGLSESGEYTLDLYENDSVCCFPAVWSLVSYNATYLSAANIDQEGLLSVTVGNGLIAANNVLLATYRITCPNGDYDEANVYGDINGTTPGCLGPVDLAVQNEEPGGATVTWEDPASPPNEYEWIVYAADDLVTPIDSGTSPTGFSPNVLVITGLDPETDYVVYVRGACDDSNSTYDTVPFTTLPQNDACGQYEITVDDGTGLRGNYVDVSYIDCNSEEQTTRIFNTTSRIVCALQNAPGDPVQINYSGTGATDEYLGLC